MSDPLARKRPLVAEIDIDAPGDWTPARVIAAALEKAAKEGRDLNAELTAKAGRAVSGERYQAIYTEEVEGVWFWRVRAKALVGATGR